MWESDGEGAALALPPKGFALWNPLLGTDIKTANARSFFHAVAKVKCTRYNNRNPSPTRKAPEHGIPKGKALWRGSGGSAPGVPPAS